MEIEELSKEDKAKLLSAIMSELGKRSHQKSPRPKEYFSKIALLRWAKQKKNNDD